MSTIPLKTYPDDIVDAARDLVKNRRHPGDLTSDNDVLVRRQDFDLLVEMLRRL